jgi:hypothetical protein
MVTLTATHPQHPTFDPYFLPFIPKNETRLMVWGYRSYFVKVHSMPR